MTYLKYGVFHTFYFGLCSAEVTSLPSTTVSGSIPDRVQLFNKRFLLGTRRDVGIVLDSFCYMG